MTQTASTAVPPWRTTLKGSPATDRRARAVLLPRESQTGARRSLRRRSSLSGAGRPARAREVSKGCTGRCRPSRWQRATAARRRRRGGARLVRVRAASCQTQQRGQAGPQEHATPAVGLGDAHLERAPERRGSAPVVAELEEPRPATAKLNGAALDALDRHWGIHEQARRREYGRHEDGCRYRAARHGAA